MDRGSLEGSLALLEQEYLGFGEGWKQVVMEGTKVCSLRE